MVLIKHFKILEFTLSSLWRRRYKNLGIISVFTFVIFILSSILFLTHSFKKEAVTLLKDSPELIVQRIMGGRHDLIPESYESELRKMPGIGSAIPRYWGYYFDAATGANYSILGAGGLSENALNMVRGTSISNPWDCIIGSGVSDARFARIGTSIPLTGSDGKLYVCRVVGIFDAGSRLIANDLIIMSPGDVRTLFGIPEGKATDMVIDIYNPSEVSNIARKIKERFPDTRPITRHEILRTYDTLFSWRSGLILTMFFGALIAFAILAWDKATGLSAEERREIGILKAIGWETSDVLELKFWEGLAISILSFHTGTIGAYIHVFFLGATVFSPALKGWSVLFPGFHLMPYIDMYQIFVLLFLTVVPYVASTIVPSWKAAITDPDMVMRG